MGITLKDIAKESGVSIATVSRVLNNSGYVKEETRKVIEDTIIRMNYTPSVVTRTLSRNENITIGVVIPDINNPFFCEVIKGIATIADKENLNLIICDTDEQIEREFKALKMLKETKIQGLIITPTSDKNEFNCEYIEALESMKIPLVLIDRDVKYSNYDAVFLDNIKGAYDATNVLIKEGHKKIAIIAGPTSSKPGRDRVRGYEKALLMNKLRIDSKYIFHGDFKQESGYAITKEILNMKDRPTAIFACNNMMNLGCIKALYEENFKIPQDIALIGFDEIEILNVLEINISAVSRPTSEMGQVAMEILVDKIKNKEKIKAKRFIFAPKLNLKGSEKLISK